MTAPLSQDLRARIVRAVEGGTSARAAAERFEVSPSAAIKLMQRVRQTGSTAPAQIGGHRRPVLEPHAETVRALATSKASITLKEIRAALAERGIEVKALSTVADMLHRLGLSHKKTPEGSGAGPARRGAPPRVLARLAALHGWRAFRVPG
jgi:putative transposase